MKRIFLKVSKAKYPTEKVRYFQYCNTLQLYCRFSIVQYLHTFDNAIVIAEEELTKLYSLKSKNNITLNAQITKKDSIKLS